MGRPDQAQPSAWRRPGYWARAAGAVALLALAGMLLGRIYLTLSETVLLSSDDANILLAAHAAGHGNPLLHGWTVARDSFYLTDLPVFGLADALSGGPSAAVIHRVGAGVYAALVLSAVLLAGAGSAGGPGRRVRRMLITGLLLLAPVPGLGARTLMLGTFHVSTAWYLLLVFLVLHLTRGRWAGAVLGGAMLAAIELSDPLAIFAGGVPLALVSGARLLDRRGPGSGQGRTDDPRSDVQVLFASLLSVPASALALFLLQALGGFHTAPTPIAFAKLAELPGHAGLMVRGLMVLFGADLRVRPEGVAWMPALAHVLGLVVAALSVLAAAVGWLRGRRGDPLTQALAAAVAVDLAAFVFSNQPLDIFSSRYLIPAYVFAAVLAGRVAGERLRGLPVTLAAVAPALVYLAFLGVSLRTPAAPEPTAELAAFLVRQDLHGGLADYWDASVVTVQAGGAVHVRSVTPAGSGLGVNPWEADRHWYDPATNRATFVIVDTADPRSISEARAAAAFGPPDAVRPVGAYRVLIWHKNLLENVAGAKPPGQRR